MRTRSRGSSLGKTLGRLKKSMRKFSRTSEEGEAPRAPAADPYYDELAREIFEQLGRKKGGKQYKALDSIYKHPENGATVYVGKKTDFWIL